MTKNSSAIPLLAAVTATTTSAGTYVGNATKMAILLTAAAISSGNGAFTFEVSMDPVGTASPTWLAYNRMVDNVTNTNAQTDTRVASKTLSSNTSALLFVPDADMFSLFRTIVTRTTDGTYSAKLLIQTDG